MPQPDTDHRWRRTPPPALSQTQKDWLMRPGALTSALRQVGKLELRVLTERVRSLPREDSRLVGLPAADMLYHDVSIQRSDFEVARLARRCALFQTVRRNLSVPDPFPLLARRSVFWRHGQALLVSETFLPAFWENVQ